MTILFKLGCVSAKANSRKAFANGPVPAVNAAAIGIHIGGDVFKPDPEAVRLCLPSQWRAAWDRTDGQFWFPTDVTKPATLTLRTSRGAFLATIYATPYHA